MLKRERRTEGRLASSDLEGNLYTRQESGNGRDEVIADFGHQIQKGSTRWCAARQSSEKASSRLPEQAACDSYYLDAPFDKCRLRWLRSIKKTKIFIGIGQTECLSSL